MSPRMKPNKNPPSVMVKLYHTKKKAQASFLSPSFPQVIHRLSTGLIPKYPLFYVIFLSYPQFDPPVIIVISPCGHEAPHAYSPKKNGLSVMETSRISDPAPAFYRRRTQSYVGTHDLRSFDPARSVRATLPLPV